MTIPMMDSDQTVLTLPAIKLNASSSSQQLQQQQQDTTTTTSNETRVENETTHAIDQQQDSNNPLSVLASIATSPQPPLVVEAFHLVSFEAIGKWCVYKVSSSNQLLFKVSDILQVFYTGQGIPFDESKLDAFFKSQDHIVWNKNDPKKPKPIVSVYYTRDGQMYLSSETLGKLASEFHNEHVQAVASLSRPQLFSHDFSGLKGYVSKSPSFAPTVLTLNPLNPAPPVTTTQTSNHAKRLSGMQHMTPPLKLNLPPHQRPLPHQQQEMNVALGKRPHHEEEKDRPGNKARKILSIDTSSPTVQNGRHPLHPNRPYPQPPATAIEPSARRNFPPFIPGRPYQYTGPVPAAGPHPHTSLRSAHPNGPWLPSPHGSRPPTHQSPPPHMMSRGGPQQQSQPHHHGLPVPRHQGVEHLVSPRTEFPNRELPLPRGMEPRDIRTPPNGKSINGPPPAPHTAHPLSQHQHLGPSQQPSSMIPPPPMSAPTRSHPHHLPSIHHSNASDHAMAVPKQQFMAMFEAYYDQMDSVSRLQTTLQEQLRKSTTLLQTLSSSGQMIEDLVRSRFREMQASYTEKFGNALTELHVRLSALEKKVGVEGSDGNHVSPGPKSADSNQGAALSATTPTGKRLLHPPEALPVELLQRIEALEAQLRREP